MVKKVDPCHMYRLTAILVRNAAIGVFRLDDGIRGMKYNVPSFGTLTLVIVTDDQLSREIAMTCNLLLSLNVGIV